MAFASDGGAYPQPSRMMRTRGFGLGMIWFRRRKHWRISKGCPKNAFPEAPLQLCRTATVSSSRADSAARDLGFKLPKPRSLADARSQRLPHASFWMTAISMLLRRLKAGLSKTKARLCAHLGGQLAVIVQRLQS